MKTNILLTLFLFLLNTQIVLSNSMNANLSTSENHRFDNREDLFWCSQGPDNFAGGVRSICVNRLNEQHIYVATRYGGLFESNNGGQWWNRVENWTHSMNISSIVQTVDGTVFVGAGNHYFDNYFMLQNPGTGTYFKNANDPNASWELVPGTQSWNIRELKTNEVDNLVYIASNQGLHVWDKTNQTLNQLSTQNAQCSEVTVSTDGQVILARIGASPGTGAVCSVDGGLTFTQLIGSGIGKLTSFPRYEFAISPDRVNDEFICYAIGTTPQNVGIFRSEDSGLTWKELGSGGINDGSGTLVYCSYIAVNPTDFDQFYVGSSNLFLGTYFSNSGLVGFEQLSSWELPESSELYIPRYQHNLIFESQFKMYISTDGGFVYSDDLGATFKRPNYNLHNIETVSVASNGSGKLITGTVVNGILNNNLQNETPKSFRRVFPDSASDVAMSFFNDNISFGMGSYGQLHRIIENPAFNAVQATPFLPNYVGYYTPGSALSGQDFNYNSKMGFEEYLDPNSKDSVTYLPSANLSAGTTVTISSTASGNFIEHTLSQPLYFDALVNYNPSLTVQFYQVTSDWGINYVLSNNITWNFVQGSGTPQVGDIIHITVPFDVIINVAAVSLVNIYFAQHPISGKIINLGMNQQMFNVAWDTLKVADPFQSILITHTRRNGGELYATRDALRLGQTPKWALIAQGVGEMWVGEIVITPDLANIYVGTNAGLWRIDGFGDAYSSDPSFSHQTDLRQGDAPMISKTKIYNGVVRGIGLNPNDNGDLVIARASSNQNQIFRSLVANTTSDENSFSSIQNNLPTNINVNDVLVDVYNDEKLFAATEMGLWSSQNGGETWVLNSDGLGESSINRIIQNWRVNEPNTTKPGEIYLATAGLGIYSTGECSDFASTENFNLEENNVSLLVYPNPLKDEANLQIEISNSSRVSIEVYSIAGKLTAQQNLFLEQGKNVVQLNTEHYENGLYLVKIVSLHGATFGKFIKH